MQEAFRDDPVKKFLAGIVVRRKEFSAHARELFSAVEHKNELIARVH
jgi:hypothetical protein